jgi:hypothetical protein
LTSWRIDILVLSKKPSEQVVIGGGITASGASVLGNKVRLAFTVPDQDRILRANSPAGRMSQQGATSQLTLRVRAERKMSDRHGEAMARR